MLMECGEEKSQKAVRDVSKDDAEDRIKWK